jgi:glycosyltransferase involved in cell wall biosynthesis
VQALIASENVADRVELVPEWISDERKWALLATALACCFVPFDEDYGYVTLESFASRKPVITCTDSGGPLELVADGETGLVVSPEPERIAEAIDRLAEDRAAARSFGEAGFARTQAQDLSWDRVVQELTA